MKRMKNTRTKWMKLMKSHTKHSLTFKIQNLMSLLRTIKNQTSKAHNTQGTLF
jgi:hypothetical protein